MSDQPPPFTLDSELCAGHGRCYALAPESFDADDMGYAVVRDTVDGEPTRDPNSIVNACPEGAIALATTAGKGSPS
ncbi:ferredoxin [Pseudonocardia sp. KRD291]|uniref:ferredoxin n=1 Tax=Pseudonocardia sp. KRD291 TaxID=2792007 RepID=UPI001C4A67CA|nr:ferredoxin [Pseudonocardia sp. KRD291]MBW0101211.1 ferredoxin [Pseudonocardia sp. KRD291]